MKSNILFARYVQSTRPLEFEQLTKERPQELFSKSRAFEWVLLRHPLLLGNNSVAGQNSARPHEVSEPTHEFPSRNSSAFREQRLREPRNRSHFDAPSDDKLYRSFTAAGPSRCIPDFQVVRGTVGPSRLTQCAPAENN